MELVIQTEDFTVKVNTESKLKKGDIYCGLTAGFEDNEKKDGSYSLPPEWFLSKVTSDNMANFFNLVDKHYKVVEILKSKNEKEI